MVGLDALRTDKELDKGQESYRRQRHKVLNSIGLKIRALQNATGKDENTL